MEPKEGIFNEESLKQAIIEKWGEFGAHAEVIKALISQRNGFRDQFNEQKRLFDSSQEEVKRLKEENKLLVAANGGYSFELQKANERVKELTELVKEAYQEGCGYGWQNHIAYESKGQYPPTNKTIEEFLKSKGINL